MPITAKIICKALHSNLGDIKREVNKVFGICHNIGIQHLFLQKHKREKERKGGTYATADVFLNCFHMTCYDMICNITYNL